MVSPIFEEILLLAKRLLFYWMCSKRSKN